MWLTVVKFLLECSVVFLVVLIIKYYLEKRRIFWLGSKLPGPKPLPIIGNALEFVGSDLDILGIVNRLNKKYGLAAVWLGPKLNVFICSPEHAEIYLTSPNFLDHSDNFKFLEPALGKGLLTSNGEDWKINRKLLEPSFCYSILKSFIPIISEHGDILLTRLQTQVGKKSFSLLPIIKNCFFDIITESTMEIKLNNQEHKVSKLLENSDKLLYLMGTRMYKVWQQWDFLYKFLKDGIEFRKRFGEIKEFVDKQIKMKKESLLEEKIRKEIDGEDMEASTARSKVLKRLLEDGRFTDDELRDHVLTIVATGYETSALTICFAMVMLALHPDIQDKAYQEISTVADKKLFSEESLKLEYLDRVVKETLRVYPVASILFRKSADDIQLGEYLIPKGTTVSLNIHALHRDPTQYQNPENFNPDLFLPENVAKRNPHSYAPFGGGLRKCIGNKFAMMTIKVILAKIIKNYKVECDFKMEDIELRFNVSTRIKNGFNVRLLNR